MDGRTKVIIAVVTAVALLSLALVIFIPFGETDIAKDDPLDGPSDDPGTDPGTPGDDDPITEPETSPYPEGISYDADSGTLASDMYSEWSVTDELKAHIDKTSVKHYGNSITLDPGFYRVSVGGETFYVSVDGTESRTVTWNYLLNGQTHEVSVTYDIDISELSEVMMASREFNSDQFLKFEDLPELVYIDQTVRSIASQLRSEFIRIGGSVDDRQSYADFIVSFAQLGIKYPSRPYVWTDEEGNAVLVDGIPKISTDYEVWGCEDYWANALETLHHGVGDCEDSAAVACSLLKASGFSAAMVGMYGHVTAGAVLDDPFERDLSEYRSVIGIVDMLVWTSGNAVTGDDGTTYYAVDTVNGQVPVGYITAGPAQTLNSMSPWGMAGFYPA
jgi:hypothetical protein